MKKIEKSLFEGFIDDIFGGSSSIGGAGYDAETAATAEFEKKFLDRGLRGFNNAWKNDGIDLTKSGIAPSAPVATAAGLGLTPSGQPVPAPTTAPVATAAGLGLTPSGQPVPAASTSPQQAPAPSTPQQATKPAIQTAFQNPQQSVSPAGKMNITYQGKPIGNTSGTAAKPATKQPGMSYSMTIPASKPQQAAAPAAPQASAAPATSEPLTWGGQKYTKGPKGWVNSKGKLADVNTAKVLDQAAQQAAQPTAAPTQAAPQQTTQQPAAPQAKKKRTGGRVAGQLSTNPVAVARRQANAAKKAAANTGTAVKQTSTQQQTGSPLNYYKAVRDMRKRGMAVNEEQQFKAWDHLLQNMLLSEASSPNGVSPSEFMYDLVVQQLRGYDLDSHPNQKKTIITALTRWENALKQQIQNSQGEFKGFQGDTKKAFEDLAELLSSVAFGSLSAKKTQGQQTQGQQTQGQPRRTP